MFTNLMVPYEAKSIINPVSGGGYYTGIGSGGGNCDVTTGGSGIIELDLLELESLRRIEQFYTSQLANKTYENIPHEQSSYIDYLHLLNVVHVAQTKYATNAPLALLFKITEEGLKGSSNSYGLNMLNIKLTIENTDLHGVLEEIINGYNVIKAFDMNTGTLAMTQKFELAPLFLYYIKIYGIPDPSVGFDPVKLNIILKALEANGIDPYGA
jgi:hypothetical protein